MTKVPSWPNVRIYNLTFARVTLNFALAPIQKSSHELTTQTTEFPFLKA